MSFSSALYKIIQTSVTYKIIHTSRLLSTLLQKSQKEMQEQYSQTDNNQTHIIEQPEAMHVQEISNISFNKNTQVSAAVSGNTNRLELEQSKDQFIINYNYSYNSVFGVRTDVGVGLAGNHNTAVLDADSNTYQSFPLTNHNCYPYGQAQVQGKRLNTSKYYEQKIRPSKKFKLY